LYEATGKGEYPKWSVEIQTMTSEEAEELWEKQEINVFDLTHVWPRKQFPLRKVGEFVLNENTINYFAEIEQAAFNPSHMPPGIEPSADLVLQSRLFSYPDTHRHRIGVNYQQLPVNAPRIGFKTGDFQRDGRMAFYNQSARPNHLSSIEPFQFRERTVNLDKTHGHFVGKAVIFLSEIRPEDFNAPRALWEKVFDDAAKARFTNNVAGKMEVCPNKEVLKRQIAIPREVHPDIATRLGKANDIESGYKVSEMQFNGTHNGMAKDKSLRSANGMSGKAQPLVVDNNDASKVRGILLERLSDVANFICGREPTLIPLLTEAIKCSFHKSFMMASTRLCKHEIA
jgi:catalase